MFSKNLVLDIEEIYREYNALIAVLPCLLVSFVYDIYGSENIITSFKKHFYI